MVVDFQGNAANAFFKSTWTKGTLFNIPLLSDKGNARPKWRQHEGWCKEKGTKRAATTPKPKDLPLPLATWQAAFALLHIV